MLEGMIDAAGLRVMKAIADAGSFTGAANILGFTQPAISQMVRRLEQRTGTMLVERYGRQVRLTEAGQVLARHAVLDHADDDASEE
jgi:DNA-binding transcriptional LysR family regulator